jgi:hypothetical protein
MSTAFLAERCAEHAQRCATRIIESGYMHEDRRSPSGKAMIFPFTFKYIDDKRETDFWHAMEATYVALTHPEPIIAWRAFVSAEVHARGVKDVQLSDALAWARDRVEAFLPATASADVMR